LSNIVAISKAIDGGKSISFDYKSPNKDEPVKTAPYSEFGRPTFGLTAVRNRVVTSSTRLYVIKTLKCLFY